MRPEPVSYGEEGADEEYTCVCGHRFSKHFERGCDECSECVYDDEPASPSLLTDRLGGGGDYGDSSPPEQSP